MLIFGIFSLNFVNVAQLHILYMVTPAFLKTLIYNKIIHCPSYF